MKILNQNLQPTKYKSKTQAIKVIRLVAECVAWLALAAVLAVELYIYLIAFPSPVIN